MKAFWHRWFSSEAYRESAKARILNGTAPHLETYLLQRIYGKPTERIEVVQHEDISSLSVEELTKRAAALVDQLREAKELEDALPPVIDIKSVVDSRSVGQIIRDLSDQETTVRPPADVEIQQRSEPFTDEAESSVIDHASD